MEELKALISLINKNKIKQIELITPGKRSNSKVQKLYDLIAEGKADSDENLQEVLYGGQARKEFYYRRTKNKLKERLINTIFFIDQNQTNFTNYQKAYYSAIRHEAAIKILLARLLRQPAIGLSERVLRTAIKYELTDTVLFLARTLKLHYGGAVGDRRKYQKYRDLFTRYLKLQQLEMLAEEYYTDINFHSTNSRENKEEVMQLANRYSAELRKKTKGKDSYRLMLYSYMIHSTAFQLAGNFQAAIEVCREAIQYFDAKKNISTPTIRISFSFRILACQVNSKKFEQAKCDARSYLAMVGEGTWNWFSGMQYYLIAAFHTKDFTLAYEIVQKAVNHPGYKKLYQNLAEEWHVYQGFIHYLTRIGKIPHPPATTRFRIRKFLNEVPIYSNDKRGINITILILQILLLLERKKYGEIIDRVESIKMYAHRYLRKGNTFRSDCFIKMLMQLPAASFHKAAVIRKAEKYRQRLESEEEQATNSNPEIEIIPYELLWEYVLESLQNKHYMA